MLKDALRLQVGEASAELVRSPNSAWSGTGRIYVGLTGGIGSGKSTVAEAFADLGATVISADQLAREVVEPGTPALLEIVERFGGSVLGADGRLDRATLAGIIFSDPQARADLEGITHPRIAELAEARMRAASTPVTVYEVPLLVEREMADQFDLVVIVDAPEELRVERLVSRGVDTEDAKARIKAQASSEERVEVADVWIENHGCEEDLREVVRQVFEKWL